MSNYVDVGVQAVQPEEKKGLNLKQKLIVITLDILILVELCIAMYLVNFNQNEMTSIFVKSFFPMFLPTILIGGYLVRRCRD